MIQNKPKRILCALVASALVIGMGVSSISAAAQEQPTKIKISNPYQNVNWGKDKSYKSNMHTHTTKSDGSLSDVDMFVAYQKEKYDFLAFADHDYIVSPWPNHNINDGQTHNGIDGLGGRNGLPAQDGWKTSDLLYIKGNEVSKVGWENHHFGNYFSDFVSDGSAKNVNELVAQAAAFDPNGLQVMFHPGRYTYHPSEGSRYWNPQDPRFAKINSYFYNLPADHTWDPADPLPDAIVSWYAQLYQDNPSVVGMEVLNFGNQYERDRELWDDVLTKTMPERPVWGFANDDAHGAGDQIGRDMEFMVLENKTVHDFKEAMVDGNFYISSRYTLPGKGFNDGNVDRSGPLPEITNISVDENTGTISIDGNNFNEITWISCGEQVAVGNSIDCKTTSGVTKYVRAILTGEGGESFTQPFGIIEGEEGGGASSSSENASSDSPSSEKPPSSNPSSNSPSSTNPSSEASSLPPVSGDTASTKSSTPTTGKQNPTTGNFKMPLLVAGSLIVSLSVGIIVRKRKISNQ